MEDIKDMDESPSEPVYFKDLFVRNVDGKDVIESARSNLIIQKLEEEIHQKPLEGKTALIRKILWELRAVCDIFSDIPSDLQITAAIVSDHLESKLSPEDWREFTLCEEPFSKAQHINQFFPEIFQQK